MVGRERLGEATRSLGNKNLRQFKLDFRFGLRNLISAIDVGRKEEWCVLSSVGDLVANGAGGETQGTWHFSS